MTGTTTARLQEVRAPDWKPEDLLGRLTLGELLFSNDYRAIALKTILTSLVMLALGGLFALTFRTELALPDIQFLGARPYLGLLTVHGMIMVFGFLIPIGGQLGVVCAHLATSVGGRISVMNAITSSFRVR